MDPQLVRKRKTRYTIACVLVAITTPTLYMLSSSRAAESRYANQLAAIRAMGFPTSYDELEATTPIVKDDDAGPTYEVYAQRTKALSGKLLTEFTDLSQGPSTKSPAGILAKVSDLQGFVTLLKDGSTKPHWRQPRGMAVIHYDDIMDNGVNLIVNWAQALEASGDLTKGLQALGIAESILFQSEDPEESLFRESELLFVYEDWLHKHASDPKALNQILDVMRSELKPCDVQRNPIILFVDSIESGRTDNPGWLFGAVAKAKWKFIDEPRAKRQAAAELSLWKNAFAKFPKNRYDWKDTRAAMEEFDRAAAANPTSSYDLATKGELTVGEFLARRKLVVTEARLLLEKSKTGSFPSSLPQDPILPDHMELCDLSDIDPYTDQPLNYKRTKTGFVLYSIGKDLKDDGGLARAHKAKHWDVVLKY